jgi:hypothetical protein
VRTRLLVPYCGRFCGMLQASSKASWYRRARMALSKQMRWCSPARLHQTVSDSRKQNCRRVAQIRSDGQSNGHKARRRLASRDRYRRQWPCSSNLLEPRSRFIQARHTAARARPKIEGGCAERRGANHPPSGEGMKRRVYWPGWASRKYREVASKQQRRRARGRGSQKPIFRLALRHARAQMPCFVACGGRMCFKMKQHKLGVCITPTLLCLVRRASECQHPQPRI